MKYRAFKRCTKGYDEKFTREKETKELQIEIKDRITIDFEEHQCGMDLNEPHVDIAIPGGYSYSMDLSEFIKRITQ